MTDFTPEERRRVAERLRAIRDGAWSSASVYYNVCHALGIETPRPSEMDVRQLYRILADLIDPTCEAVGMDCTGAPPWRKDHLSLNTASSGCSVCGYPFGNERYRIPGRLSQVPRFCPNCGARVIWKTDE